MEKFEQASQDIREIEWVKQQVKAELSSLQQPVQQELFYQKDGDKVTYNLPLVKTYLEHIKEKSWSELTQKNSSAWIMAVQIALESQGYDVEKVDGLWGEFTKAAVENFQDRNGLNKDGMPGRLTIQKLAEVMGTPAKAEGTPAKA
ncbi:MAG: peptidoglycan-binding protein, partial [Candidatus Absconditicoccaceae bacterium]